MNEDRLRTCINLFNSCSNVSWYVNDIVKILSLVDNWDDTIKDNFDLADKKLETDIEKISWLFDNVIGDRKIHVDEIEKMIISLAALFISLHKENIIEKSNDKELSLLVNNRDYDDVITYIAKYLNNKYYIGDICFDTSLECLDFVRNKLLHGDYYIKEDDIYLSKDGNIGYVSFQRLIDFCFWLYKLSKCKGKVYTNGMILLSPFKGYSNNDDDLASRLFEVNVKIIVKGTRKINLNIIRLLDNIMDRAMYYNVEKGWFVAEAMNQAIMDYQEELSIQKCVIEFESDFYNKNPKANNILNKLNNEYKKLKKDELVTEYDILNYITTHTYEETIEDLDQSFLGLSKFLLKFMPNALNGIVSADINLDNFNYLYNIDIPINILKFYCYYNYGLDMIFSSGKNTNLRDIVSGNNFDYSLLDLSLFDDNNMTMDFTLNGYNDQLLSMQNDFNILNATYQNKLNNYNNFMIKNKGTNTGVEQKILATVTNAKNNLDNITDILNKAKAFDVNKYEINLNIINHLRNSIAHGHYKIDETDDSCMYYIFDDIYNGVNTYHLKIKVSDFEKIFNYKGDIYNYLKKLSATYLNKGVDRVHYEDLLLDCLYVIPNKLDDWNNLVNKVLDSKNKKDIDNLLFTFEIMREITLASIYVNTTSKLADATMLSFKRFMSYALLDDKYDKEIMINGRSVTVNEYEKILRDVMYYCSSFYDYEYDKILKEELFEYVEKGSILGKILKK